MFGRAGNRPLYDFILFPGHGFTSQLHGGRFALTRNFAFFYFLQAVVDDTRCAGFVTIEAHSCTSKHALPLLLLSNGRTRLVDRAEPILRPGAAGGWGVAWSEGVSNGEGVTHDFHTGLSNASVLAKPVLVLIPLFSLILHRELDHNDISGTIEDTNGAFSGLDSLTKL